MRTVLSPKTNLEIETLGIKAATDEMCLSMKVYLGHVKMLIGKCDYILVPRIRDFGIRRVMCVTFEGLPDIARNVFHEDGIRILTYDIDSSKKQDEERAMIMMAVTLGISPKDAILDKDNKVLSNAYIWTEGNPIGAVKKLVGLLGENFDKEKYQVVATGTTGSARKLVGTIVGATIVKNEITAHAVGTTTFHPDVRTILEIGGQDSKIILVENGVAVDYAMNTLCAAGTGSFLSSQSRRLGIPVEEMGEIALKSQHPTQIAARCTVFAESDLVHKIQVGHTKEDIVAGLCQAVVGNYLNNVGKGKKIYSPVVFQGGVSKNTGVVKAFEKQLGCPVIVDENGHLMGAIGAAILARRNEKRAVFDFSMEDMEFVTREVNCGRCPNNCEIICVYRNGELIDSWGNRCERGEISVNAAKTLKK